MQNVIYKPAYVYMCELMLVSGREDAVALIKAPRSIIVRKNACRTWVTRREPKSQAHMAHIMKPRPMTEQ